MKTSTALTPVVSWQTKTIAEKCSSTTWCAPMHDYVHREDPSTYTKEEIAHALVSVELGKCAWCRGPMR